MNPAIFIIVILIAIGVWFVLARKNIFIQTENFIDESINMGIHDEEITDVDFETKEY
jgi:hypothetical protein